MFDLDFQRLLNNSGEDLAAAALLFTLSAVYCLPVNGLFLRRLLDVCYLTDFKPVFSVLVFECVLPVLTKLKPEPHRETQRELQFF